ncbi:hypothetical protein DITRI_Ditri08aG0025600 [Diplodiscus trichospermus]
MLLRSSSTPDIRSLLSPSSDSPNKDLDTTYRLLHGNHRQENLNLTPFSHNSTPVSYTTSRFSGFNQESGRFRLKGFRRAKSEGSLERLDYSSCVADQFLDSRTPKKSFYSHQVTMLHSAPSFSVFNEGLEDEQEGEEKFERTVTIGESIDAVGNADFSFQRRGVELIPEGDEGEELSKRTQTSRNEEEIEHEPPSPPIDLATGLRTDGARVCAMADGVGLSSTDLDEAGDLEGFHKRLVDEYPSHPLFLRNYAKFLQSKADLQGAANYYHRATLADPKNSEILLQYAKIVWNLHHDKDEALSYLERAVQASPQDSNVLGAYASFLWEVGDDGNEHGEQEEYPKVKEQKTLMATASQNSQSKEEIEPASQSLQPPNSAGFGVHTDVHVVNVEAYYRRMVQENPCNPLVLSNYARFLHQSKGDLEGAEEYYLKAIQADPSNGETMSEYAKLVWSLRRDRDKASEYFERAVEATPENSHVLAAHASFLWETEEVEDDDTKQDQTQVLHEATSRINSLAIQSENTRQDQTQASPQHEA